jgi:hypothetical protein
MGIGAKGVEAPAPSPTRGTTPVPSSAAAPSSPSAVVQVALVHRTCRRAPVAESQWAAGGMQKQWTEGYC